MTLLTLCSSMCTVSIVYMTHALILKKGRGQTYYLQSIKFYLYSQYSQNTICLIGLNNVQHLLSFTLNNIKEKLETPVRATCEAPPPPPPLVLLIKD